MDLKIWWSKPRSMPIILYLSLLMTTKLSSHLICLKKGQILSNHKSPVDYSMQSISGKTLFYEGQVTHELTPGWITNIEKNLMHKIEATEDCVLLMTQIPNPKKK
jgi:quercetin dioxygenase-like cupin family protein